MSLEEFPDNLDVLGQGAAVRWHTEKTKLLLLVLKSKKESLKNAINSGENFLKNSSLKNISLADIESKGLKIADIREISKQ